MKHLSDEQFQKFRQRSLTAQEFFEVDDHLAECNQCKEQLSSSTDLLKLKNAFSSEPDHLEFDQMASWIDGGLDDSDRISIEEHLKHCSICSGEVEDLNTFRATIKGSGQIFPFKKKSSSSLFVSVASVAAVIAMLTTAAIFWFQNRELHTKLKQVESQNQQLQREAQRIPNQAVPAHQSEAALVLQDGDSQVRIEKDGRITATLLIPENEQQRIRAVIQNQEIDIPSDVSKLIGSKEILMGDPEKLPFHLTSPIGTAVSTERPTFRWEKLLGAENYQVRVYDEEFHQIMQSPWIRESEWTSVNALPSGKPLTWQVAAKKVGEEITSPFAPFPDVKFLVLQSSEIQKAKEIQSKYSGFHLLLGVQFMQLGLLDDAESEFVALQKANPESIEVSTLLNNFKKIRNQK